MDKRFCQCCRRTKPAAQVRLVRGYLRCDSCRMMQRNPRPATR